MHGYALHTLKWFREVWVLKMRNMILFLWLLLSLLLFLFCLIIIIIMIITFYWYFSLQISGNITYNCPSICVEVPGEQLEVMMKKFLFFHSSTVTEWIASILIKVAYGLCNKIIHLKKCLFIQIWKLLLSLYNMTCLSEYQSNPHSFSSLCHSLS